MKINFEMLSLFIDSMHPAFAHAINPPANPGPAFNSGAIQEGDILSEIDGHNVLRCHPSQISLHLLGPEESSVTVVFLRGEERIAVSLVRRHRRSLAAQSKWGSAANEAARQCCRQPVRKIS